MATGFAGLGATDGTAAFYRTETAWVVVHLLILFGLVGLVRSGAVGELAWGTTWFGAAIAGRIIFVVPASREDIWGHV